MAKSDIQERLAAVKDLIAVFRAERLVYLSITVMALMALLGTVFWLVEKGQAGITELSVLFGSAGAISYTTSRLLKMWTDALGFVRNVIGPEKSDGN